MASLARRQQEIEDELDLTKSQAPNGLDGKSDEASTEDSVITPTEVEVHV